MKLMIASDLHGSAYYTQALLRRMEDEKPAKLVLLGYTLYLTHGHHLDEASKAAAPGDIVLYGHTHVPAFEQKNGNYYVNPGSVSIPKEGSRHSYMLWENGVFTWKDVETGEIWRTERIEK